MVNVGNEVGAIAVIAEETLEKVHDNAHNIESLLEFHAAENQPIFLEVKKVMDLRRKVQRYRLKFKEMNKNLAYRARLLDENGIKYTKKL